MDAQERAHQAIARLIERSEQKHAEHLERLRPRPGGPVLDMVALTGRTAARIPRQLQDHPIREKDLIAAFGGDPNVAPSRGGLIGQKNIVAFVAQLPEPFNISRRQLFNTLFRKDDDGACVEPWLRQCGDIIATHPDSAENWATKLHPIEALTAHLNALGVNVGGASNVWESH
jgi:hypothetical protein